MPFFVQIIIVATGHPGDWIRLRSVPKGYECKRWFIKSFTIMVRQAHHERRGFFELLNTCLNLIKKLHFAGFNIVHAANNRNLATVCQLS